MPSQLATFRPASTASATTTQAGQADVQKANASVVAAEPVGQEARQRAAERTEQLHQREQRAGRHQRPAQPRNEVGDEAGEPGALPRFEARTRDSHAAHRRHRCQHRQRPPHRFDRTELLPVQAQRPVARGIHPLAPGLQRAHQDGPPLQWRDQQQHDAGAAGDQRRQVAHALGRPAHARDAKVGASVGGMRDRKETTVCTTSIASSGPSHGSAGSDRGPGGRRNPLADPPCTIGWRGSAAHGG